MDDLLKDYDKNYITTNILALNTIEKIEFPLFQSAPMLSKKEFIYVIQTQLSKIRKLSSRETVSNDSILLVTVILDALTMILKYKHYYSDYQSNNQYIIKLYKDLQTELLKHVNHSHREYLKLMAKYEARINEFPEQNIMLKYVETITKLIDKYEPIVIDNKPIVVDVDKCENNNNKRPPLKDNVIVEPPKKQKLNAFDILMRRSKCK